MAEGLTTNLMLVAFWVGVVGLWIVSRDIPFPIALPIVVLKIAIPLFYFAWFSDGTWTFLDDINYYLRGREMLMLNFNPITALINPEGRLQLLILSGGPHILYAWWNLVGQYFFGMHYYAPVFLNVMLTFVCGFFSVRLLREIGFNRRYQCWFLVFFLLHWDVIAWSSFANLKDTLVMTLTTLSLFLLIKFFHKPKFLTLLAIIALSFTFLWIRFYVIFFLLGVFFLWIFISWNDRRKYILLAVTVVVFFMLPLGRSIPQFLVPREVLNGLLRFPLTPRPWCIEESYSFLLLPSIVHWLLFVPTFYTGLLVWRSFKPARLPLLYLLVMGLFYAMVPLLQGPRHRAQATFVVAWLQFHFFWVILNTALPHTECSVNQDLRNERSLRGSQKPKTPYLGQSK